MPNKNYQKGYAKERRIVNRFREKGILSFRSAGSHSPIDVIAIDHVNHIIHLIQAKPKTMSDNAKQKLLDEHPELNGTYQVEFIVV